MGFELPKSSSKPLWDRKAGQEEHQLSILHFSSEMQIHVETMDEKYIKKRAIKRKK